MGLLGGMSREGAAPGAAMRVCVDVDYRPAEAVATGLGFLDWRDAVEATRHMARLSPVAPYQPGEFYRRELPCILAVLELVPGPLSTVVIDGHVWLAEGVPGLGAHLYEALGRRVPVVGVAKKAYRGSSVAEKVLRGGSARPVFVTAAGMEARDAAAAVASMHGAHRIPTLLRRVDQVARRA
jgi:deoxyribonuclease V